MKRSTVTYRQLDKVLRSLGFSCRLVTDEPPPTRVYEHPKTGALIMLPALADSERVFAYHLVAVRGELENFGIADPTTFDGKLQKAS
jgi:hypothetical protein